MSKREGSINDKNSEKNGKGKRQYSDGDVYDGPWVNGRRHGSNGTYIYYNRTGGDWTSEKYVGDWSDDNKHGHGKMVFANGDKYEGPWVNGNMEGDKGDKGIYTWKCKSKYEGIWENDKMKGKGTFKDHEGNVYEGMFENNEKNGEGSFKFANGDVYQGPFLKGDAHGKGIWKFANGDVFEGMFSNNLAHGKGIYRYRNGKTVEQNYINGQLPNETVSAEQAATTTSGRSGQPDDTLSSSGDD